MHNKILHLIETKGPGGAETIYLHLVKGMAKRGYECVAGITGPGWVKEQLEKEKIIPFILPTNGSFDLNFLFSVIKCVKKNKIDLIHSHLFGTNVYASFAGIMTRKKVISTFHGVKDLWYGHKIIHALKRRIINKGSTYVVTVSEALKKELCEKGLLNSEKVKVIYNGVDLNKFRPESSKQYKEVLGFKKDNLLVGMIGNIRQTKGYEYLINSAAIVKEIFPNVKYLIVGHASNEDYQRLAELTKKLCIEETVHFLGFRQDTHNIYSCLDVFVLASTSEGFSIATIEALAAGIPVVCTRSGGPEEIITHKKDGLLVPVGDANALAEAICRLLSDRELASHLSQEGLKTVRRFSIEAMLDHYETLYSKCLGTSG